MHELSLAAAVIDTAERHAGGRRVTRVRLRLGELRQVVPDSLAFYFEHVARGTLCEGAVLEHEVVSARLGCATCGATWDLDSVHAPGSGPQRPVPGPQDRGQTRALRVRPRASFRCPRCDAADVGVESGDELEVESIEVEEPACTG
jgi:hydrogenase nickel incorporation protein HypA/HybF